MYLLFRYKNWKPTDYWNMVYGERRIAHAFMEEEMEGRAKELEYIKNLGK